MLTSRFIAGLSLPTLVLLACGGNTVTADDVANDDAPSASTSLPDGSSDDAGKCTASFVWLQKDAYKETGGRSTEVWPPHTTTQLIVECPNGTRSPFQGNHGSEPGQLDVNGRALLDEVHRESTTLSVAEADQLIANYMDCACEPNTPFLSMYSLDESLVPDLLKEFISFVEDSGLKCGDDGADTDSFITALTDRDFETALHIAPTCDWTGGNAESGLNDALQHVLANTSETLADYHVCNNDAKLQASLFRGFASTGTLTACDRSSAACKGPLWFYEPTDP